MIRQSILCFVVASLVGCGAAAPVPRPGMPTGGSSDPDRVRTADVSILFIGNSHTANHDLTGTVCAMIRVLRPGATVYSHFVSVGFMEELAHRTDARDELESRPWTHVVLQAQKISASGRFEYSRTEAIDFAKAAKARGMAVHFYPEWGLKGVAGDGERQEAVYRAMAREAGVGVAPVARAWDAALAERPEMKLHSSDGNHQSEIGAFLTTCVLASQITGRDPASLAGFSDPSVEPADREFLARIAARTMRESRRP